MVDRPITYKQERFIEEYCVDCNATQAAIRAGYAESGAHVNGHRLLRNDKILPFILEKQKELGEECHVEAKEVIEEIKKLAFANMQDYTSINANGKPEIDLSRMTRDQAAALSEITNRGIKFHSKDSALEKLCKHLGLYAKEDGLTIGDITIVIEQH